MVSGGRQKSFFLSAYLALSIVCQQRFGGQQQQQWEILEGRRAERRKCVSPVTISLQRREKGGKKEGDLDRGDEGHRGGKV